MSDENQVKLPPKIVVEQKSDKSLLDTLQKLSVILSAVAVPTVLGVMGFMYNSTNSKRDTSLKYVDLALQILSAEQNEDELSDTDIKLRQYAVAVLEESSPVELPEGLAESFQSGDSSLPSRSIETGLIDLGHTYLSRYAGYRTLANLAAGELEFPNLRAIDAYSDVYFAMAAPPLFSRPTETIERLRDLRNSLIDTDFVLPRVHPNALCQETHAKIINAWDSILDEFVPPKPWGLD